MLSFINSYFKKIEYIWWIIFVVKFFYDIHLVLRFLELDCLFLVVFESLLVLVFALKEILVHGQQSMIFILMTIIIFIVWRIVMIIIGSFIAIPIISIAIPVLLIAWVFFLISLFLHYWKYNSIQIIIIEQSPFTNITSAHRLICLFCLFIDNLFKYNHYSRILSIMGWRFWE